MGRKKQIPCEVGRFPIDDCQFSASEPADPSPPPAMARVAIIALRICRAF